MTLDAVWPYFVLMAVVMALAALPLFRGLDETPLQHTRYTAVDGLRGFLALGVFVFHLVVTHGFIETGVWQPPSSRFHGLLGPVGVSVFFMLTGFLFWGKLLRANGRPRWGALYVGRLFRIGPMYLAVVIAMLCVVAVRSGFAWREPVGAVLAQALQWLALGIIDTQPDVNGVAAKHVLAGVTWTIAYEWGFYASLMAMALFARRRVHLLFVLTALLACIAAKMRWHIDALGFAALFTCGMGVASLLHEGLRLRWPDRAASALALACLVVLFTTFRGGYGTGAALLLAVFFYLVCSGATLFGLLTTHAAQRLGRISYSLYLMQGLVLTLVFGVVPIRTWAMASPWAYWSVGGVCACLLVLAAAMGYVFIERPGIALGQRLLQRAGPKRGEGLPPEPTLNAG